MTCAWCGGMGPESGVECEHCRNNALARTQYLEIAPAPYDEPCAQVGEPNYRKKALAELVAFQDQLSRIWPDGDFRIVWFNHEFGTYGQVCAFYAGGDIQEDIAYDVEANAPGHWDDRALRLLKKNSPQRS